MTMQRFLHFLWGSYLLLSLGAGMASGQTERILLIGGNYRLQSNFNTTQGGFFGAPLPEDDDDTERFLDTRLRLFFDFRPSPLITVNYKLEIGDIVFGADTPLRDSQGRELPNYGGNGGGEVNVETKNAYIDVQIPWVPGLSFRGGIIGWGDQFDWAILATDFTGFQLTYQRQALWTQFTFLKFFEGSLRRQDDSNWFALDARYGLSARTSLTGSVYVWDDNDNDNPVTDRNAYQVYAGLKLNTILFNKALVELSGVYNFGQEYLGQSRREGPDGLVRSGLTGSDNRGFMANLHIDYPIRKHWIGLTLQYISGEEGSRASLDGSGRDVNAFLGLFNSQYSGFGVSRYTEGGGLELITLGQMNDSTSGLNNISVSPFFGGGYNGRILAALRGKIQATPVVFVYGAIGLDQAAENNEQGEASRGAEFNAYVHWDIIPKLWVRVGGAYYLTMDWWKNNSDIPRQGFPDPLELETDDEPKNIFQIMLRLQYNFG